MPAPAAPIKALAHLTGGGFIENIPRVLPDGLGAVVRRGAWPVPPLFTLIQQRGQVTEDEMYHVFNMGIGMVAVVAPADCQRRPGRHRRTDLHHRRAGCWRPCGHPRMTDTMLGG